MASPKKHRADIGYANLMAELKMRIEAINSATSNSLPIRYPFALEFCYLQIRMICELVALGCLIAHGDISHFRRLRKEWSAERIMTEVEKLHPDFFPRAVKLGPGTVDFVEPPRMTRQEMLSLYGRCGGALHRGRAHDLSSTYVLEQVSWHGITRDAQKILDLLGAHTITLVDRRTFLCQMQGFGEQVTITVFDAPP